MVNSCVVLDQLSGGFGPGHFQQLNTDERPRDPGIVMNNLHISVVVLMIVQSPTVWNEEHPHDLSLQQPTCAQVCTDNTKTKLTLELNDLPLILELAVHANDLEFTEMLIVTLDVTMPRLANQET